MRVLAIDPGSTCGWALSDGGRIISSGVWDLAPKRGDSPGVRYLILMRMMEVCEPLDLIVYERAHHRGGAATEYGLGYATHIQSWCAARRNVEYKAVASSTLKAFVLGRAPKRKKGSPKFDRSKAAVMAAVERANSSIVVIDDNHGDAIALMMYALANLCPGNAGRRESACSP